MKIPIIAIVLLAIGSIGPRAQTPTTATSQGNVPSPTDYQIVQQDGNSRVWQREIYEQEPNGQIVARPHQFTELATGLNFKDSSGQWQPSKEEIDIQPDGTFSATQGQHQVFFPGNIYGGEIELVQPNGVQLHSCPVGLSYDDGSNTVLIAVLTNSIGQLVGSNQIIYTNAFVGLDADLLYNYTKSGLEQDVVLRERPPTPASLGLNPETTRLQVLTEFFDPPQPSQTTSTLPEQAGLALTDDTLDFGTMQMAPGKAFILGDDSPSARVGKSWVTLQGRQFLVEAVPVAALAEQLESLPAPSAQTVSTAKARVVSRNLVLPPQPLAKAGIPPLKLARTGTSRKPGVVLDYLTVNSSLTNYTFQGSTTYYISGSVYLYGTNTFVGGAVLKYATNASVNLGTESGNWLGSADRPVIFTAKDDNSVGDTISGSTGNPTNSYANPALNFTYGGVFPAFTISDLCIAWAAQAINGSSSQLTIYNGQLVNCQNGINWQYGEAYLRNTLFANDNIDFTINDAAAYAQNTTFSGNYVLATSSSGASLIVTNCILANVAHLTYSSSQYFSGDHNGFYNCQEFGTGTFTNSFYPFKTAGAGNYYLTNGSPYRDVGTTNIDPTLLAELQTMTTYAPQDGGFPDTNTPDLGYHYPIIPNDSTGTDFWLAFYSLVNGPDSPQVLSLYISSQAGATGTVGFFVNGPILVVTNCGDTSVNGSYALTNMTGPVLSASMSFFGDSDETNGYVKGADWVINEGDFWYMVEYDSSTTNFTGLYGKSGLNLNGSSNDWESFGDANPPPTTICPQIPLSLPFTVGAGAVTNISIPYAVILTNYDIIETNGIHITASQPVSVYGFDYYEYDSAAFTGYPTTLLGTNYCVLARAADYSSESYHPGYSELAIVATADDTTVTITPSANADLTGSLWTTPIILNQGQTYQIDSAQVVDDVTGTFIKSDKPIAVFAGAYDGHVPDEVTGTANPLVQEQLPVEQWGTNVVALSFAGRFNGDTYRVLAASNNTVITITGNVVTPDESSSPWTVTTSYQTLTVTNQAGEFFETNIDGPVQFQSTKPIQVAQFANGLESDQAIDANGNLVGDPCEILLPPAGHWMNSYTVYTSTNDDVTGDFDDNYLNLIVAQSGTNTTLLDGTLVGATNFVPIGSSGYCGAQITITNSGAHTVTSSQPVEVQVYGWGNADAYSYFGGLTQ